MSTALDLLFSRILEARRSKLLAKPYARTQPIASDLSPCARETALGLLHWEQRPPFDVRLMARLQMGQVVEDFIVPLLQTMGFKVVEQQVVFELRDRKGRVALRGKCDGKLELDSRTRVPFDIKSIHPNIFPRLNTIEDLLDSPFYSKWVRQIWAYEFGHNIDLGFLFLVSLTGEWKFIEVHLDYGAMEKVLQQCEAALDAKDAVQKGHSEDLALPPFHPERAVCESCWCFQNICFPPVGFDGASILNDPELEAALDRRAELKPMSSEYDALDRDLKKRLEGCEKAIVGKWLIEGKERTRNVTASEARTDKWWQLTYTHLTGEAKNDPGRRSE